MIRTIRREYDGEITCNGFTATVNDEDAVVSCESRDGDTVFTVRMNRHMVMEVEIHSLAGDDTESVRSIIVSLT